MKLDLFHQKIEKEIVVNFSKDEAISDILERIFGHFWRKEARFGFLSPFVKVRTTKIETFFTTKNHLSKSHCTIWERGFFRIIFPWSSSQMYKDLFIMEFSRWAPIFSKMIRLTDKNVFNLNIRKSCFFKSNNLSKQTTSNKKCFDLHKMGACF